MFVMDYYGHKLSNGVLFAHHLILDVPGGSSNLAYRRRVAICNNPGTRVLNCTNPLISSFFLLMVACGAIMSLRFLLMVRSK